MENKSAEYFHKVSYGFKITMVVLLFFITSFHLALVFYFPNTEIIPDKALLFIPLVIISYLWIQELKDFYNLLALHKDLQETQQQLIQAGKMQALGVLASGIAHEVKNPLAIIVQGVEYLSRNLPKESDENISSTLNYISEAIVRADNIVKGLLDFSGKSEMKLTITDLNSVIESSLLLVKNRISAHQIEIIRALDKDIPSLNIDKNKIEQVFINLFINAIDAMPVSGKLKIRTYTKELNEVGDGVGRRKEDPFKLGGKVVIAEIEDTGSGIPEDILDKIFDPFFSTKRNIGGTGLGLSIVRNIIEMHHGKIKIANNKNNNGIIVNLMFKL